MNKPIDLKTEKVKGLVLKAFRGCKCPVGTSWALNDRACDDLQDIINLKISDWIEIPDSIVECNSDSIYLMSQQGGIAWLARLMIYTLNNPMYVRAGISILNDERLEKWLVGEQRAAFRAYLIRCRAFLKMKRYCSLEVTDAQMKIINDAVERFAFS